jgi:hypothetical protein
MQNFANSILTEDRDNTSDAPGARLDPASDDGSEVTPMFTAAVEMPSVGLAEQDHQPGVSDQVVREQVQRVRLDLLARETERLDRRLAQMLEQQQEDRQLRERLQAEVGNLCQRVEQLIGATQSGPTGGSAGADLRTTVKPLLQAVLEMLDGPGENQESTGEMMPPQRQQGPQRPQSGTGSGPLAVAVHSPPPGRAEAAIPTARAAGSALPPAPGAARPAQAMAARMPPPAQHHAKPKSQHWSAEEVEDRAVALQRALSRLDQATKPSLPRPQPGLPPAPPPAARVATSQPRPDPAPAAGAAPLRPEAGAALLRPESPSLPKAAPPRPDPGDAPAKPTFEKRMPDLAGVVDPMGEMDDSLGAEDPTIEIARLLRPVEARTPGKPEIHRPHAAAESAASLPVPETSVVPPASQSSVSAPAARPPAHSDPDPLVLGTSETPEIGGRNEGLPTPPEAVGAAGQSGFEQAPGRTDLAWRAREVAASDRSATATPGHSPGERGSRAMPPPVSAEQRPEPPAASTSAGPETEPLGEALPRCLTEPWDEPDPDWMQAGQDKGSRRWPFRRGRSGGGATGQRDDNRPAPHGGQTGPDDGTEWPK